MFLYVILQEALEARAWRSLEETVVFADEEIWRAAIGKELECDREPESSHERYAAIAREDAGKGILSDEADRPWA